MTVITKAFPLPRIQCGAMLGNGKLGFLLWGENNTLHITAGCGDLWDHRGGMPIRDRQNWEAVCEALQRKDQAEINRIFARDKAGTVTCPSLIPVGRISITLPEGSVLLRHELTLETGMTEVIFKTPEEIEKCLRFCCDMLCRDGLVCQGVPEKAEVRLIPSWDIFRGRDFKQHELCEHNSLEEHGFSPPERLNAGSVQGFRQELPEDPACIAVMKQNGDEFAFSLFRGNAPLKDYAEKSLPSFAEIFASGSSWWNNYWERVPMIALDHPDLEEIYYHGMYKYGIMTNPAGTSPGLQGPWIEDDRLPPWQGDYHFNINVQLCNSPGLKAGLGDHLKLLFEMIFSWREILRHNAKCFAGINDGYMLPHAVDDRCTCMGNFWTGSINHACAAWISQMMFDYCDMNSDRDYLRDKVFDFMCGTMRVFRKMIIRKKNGTLELPVSVSPEYRDAGMNAWGINSSFQLAAVHRLARNLLTAARWLDVEPDPFWLEVEEKLPLCAISGRGDQAEIALWKGLKLRESHRHHSHLGGLVPFDILNIRDPYWKKVIDNSIFQWTKSGMGTWTGWCMPWASQIRSRMKHSEMAVLILELWKKCFNNEGGGSLHDAWFPGLTFIADLRGEIMQMDGAMGAVTAVQDLLTNSEDGELHFFYGIPKKWTYAEMKEMRLPGGIRASGRYEKGHTKSLVLTASRNTEIRIRTADSENLLTIPLRKGETATLRTDAEGQLFRV